MKKSETFHLAFRCTYNDGTVGRYSGFNGTCSNKMIEYNVLKSDGIWCHNQLCDCRQFFDNGFKGERPSQPCYESTLFDDEYGWWFGAGANHTTNPPTARFIKKTSIGKIAMLTTRFPGDEDKEELRRIVGFFRIGSIEEDEYKNEETRVYSDEMYNIKFPLRLAKHTRFWEYYQNTEGEAHWGSGLYRHISDVQMKNILTSLIRDLSSQNYEPKVLEKLNHLLSENF